MERKTYERLCFEERVIIETLLNVKKSRAYIANHLSRSRSTITRELKKWIVRPTDIYKATLAQWCADEEFLSKRNYDKISQYPALKIYVYRGLLKAWSPEQIAGKIKRDYPLNSIMTISYEAIYTHIYNRCQPRVRKKLIALLHYSNSKRKSRKGAKKGRNRITDAVSIDLRPAHIELREEVGHWEGDLMIGVKQASAIGTLVERKTRFTYIIKLENRKSETVTNQFKIQFNKMDQILRKTMTYDNGMEMANHKWLTQKTGINVFFAHPYSSWERGTNENTNGLIRRFLPKGTDFNKISEKQLKYIQEMLNNRPRKILGFKTPAEMLQNELKMVVMV